MKTIKTFSILTILLCLSQCGVSKFDEKPSFMVKNATFSTWVGGLPGVRGTKVEISIIDNSYNLFESLYFQNKITKVEKVITGSKTMLIANYNTTKVLNDRILDINPKKEIKNQLPKVDNFPFQLKKNEAVLSFIENGKTKFYKIKNITTIN